MTPALRGRTAIVGIGATEFSKKAGRTELQLACESITSALADAGLSPADVDGLVSYTVDPVEETELTRSVGFAEIGYSEGAILDVDEPHHMRVLARACDADVGLERARDVRQPIGEPLHDTQAERGRFHRQIDRFARRRFDVRARSTGAEHGRRRRTARGDELRRRLLQRRVDADAGSLVVDLRGERLIPIRLEPAVRDRDVALHEWRGGRA